VRVPKAQKTTAWADRPRNQLRKGSSAESAGAILFT
jgi:hypothetical protein